MSATKLVLCEHIVNAYTGEVTRYRVGSKHEKMFYRVMPYGSTRKIFFEDESEYVKWRIREYTDFNPEPETKNHARPFAMPDDFPIMEIAPTAMRIKKC